MDSKMIGATVIKLCTKLLNEALSKINNLDTVKIIGGNHDRISKDNKEDVKGGAAEIIAYCLELLGYNVEFHPYVISHEVQGINHIILHGDKVVSSKTSEELVSLYGAQGKYNFITEAHLHRAMEKLTAKQRSKYQVIQDDKLMLRRLTLKPFFTGNYYSETLGYNTNAGYSILWANHKGLPKMLDNTI
jgi:predicted phosphodiesterase